MRRAIIVGLLVATTPARGATFGDDVGFLRAHVEVIVLDGDGGAKVAVVPGWQGRGGGGEGGGGPGGAGGGGDVDGGGRWGGELRVDQPGAGELGEEAGARQRARRGGPAVAGAGGGAVLDLLPAGRPLRPRALA